MGQDNIVLQITEKISEDNLPVFYKYRYTFEKNEKEDIEKQIDLAKSIINFILKYYCVGGKLTAGIEHFSKGMHACNPHLHVHFMSKVKADSIRHGLRNRFSMIGRVQSCKAEVLVDEEKFWRYCFKQQKNESLKYFTYAGFEKTYAEDLRNCAYACWKQAAEVHLAKLEKKEEKTSKDRLFVFLDTQREEIHSTKDAFILAYKYYVEYENQLNISSVNSYVNIWILKNNLITFEEFYEKYHKF